MPFKVKAITAAMKEKIAEAANALGSGAPNFSEGGGKTYEAWVLLEIANRLRTDVIVSARDHTDAITNDFRVRGAPGFIPSATSPYGAPCHFHLQGENANAELHSSLRHRGVSGDTHELDISAVDFSRATHIRNNGGGPFDAGPLNQATLMGVELKEYDDANSLPKVYARALVGVALDLEPFAHVLLAGRSGAYVIDHGGTDFWLVTTTTIGTSRQLLDHHRIAWREEVAPGQGDSSLQDLADHLRARLS
jgi:hypothetical protein